MNGRKLQLLQCAESRHRHLSREVQNVESLECKLSTTFLEIGIQETRNNETRKLLDSIYFRIRLPREELTNLPAASSFTIKNSAAINVICHLKGLNVTISTLRCIILSNTMLLSLNAQFDLNLAHIRTPQFPNNQVSFIYKIIIH